MDKLEQMFWTLVVMALILQVPDMSPGTRRILSIVISLTAIAISFAAGII